MLHLYHPSTRPGTTTPRILAYNSRSRIDPSLVGASTLSCRFPSHLTPRKLEEPERLPRIIPIKCGYLLDPLYACGLPIRVNHCGRRRPPSERIHGQILENTPAQGCAGHSHTGRSGMPGRHPGHLSARIPGADQMFIRCLCGNEKGLLYTDVGQVRRLGFDRTSDQVEGYRCRWSCRSTARSTRRARTPAQSCTLTRIALSWLLSPESSAAHLRILRPREPGRRPARHPALSQVRAHRQPGDGRGVHRGHGRPGLLPHARTRPHRGRTHRGGRHPASPSPGDAGQDHPGRNLGRRRAPDVSPSGPRRFRVRGGARSSWHGVEDL